MTCLTFVDVFLLNLYTLLVWKPICSKMPREKIKLRAVIMPFWYLKQALYNAVSKRRNNAKCFCLSVFLFVCLGFIVPLDNFSLIWRRHHYRWMSANFDLCLALMAIEQWVFFSVPHLLWHGASVYNGLLQGPGTLTPIT